MGCRQTLADTVHLQLWKHKAPVPAPGHLRRLVSYPTHYSGSAVPADTDMETLG